MTTNPEVELRPITETETKLVPLQISESQKRSLARLKLYAGRSAARLIRDGVQRLSNINDLPCSHGPFSETLNLKIPTTTINMLDEVAAKCDISRAEVIRRIIDEAYRLWDEEQAYLISMPKPFSSIF